MAEHNAVGAIDQIGAAEGDAGAHDEFMSRIGHMTRSLHESLRGLGLDKLIEKAASDIPDARDRLDYVARLSEQAAQKVLNATDAASPLQDSICTGATSLTASWKALLDTPGGDSAAGDPACTEPQLAALVGAFGALGLRGNDTLTGEEDDMTVTQWVDHLRQRGAINSDDNDDADNNTDKETN